MVRVVCTNFQPPRSRHSSGETDSIDRDLAKRAAAALSTRSLGRDNGDSEDVSCDSMCDSEGDHTEHSLHFDRPGTDENSNSLPSGEDIQRKRKQRRRERNKLSAQAYRQRRKEHEKAQQKVLTVLEEENAHLLKQVSSLEAQIAHIRNSAQSKAGSASFTSTFTSTPCPTPVATPTPTPTPTLSPVHVPTPTFSPNPMCNENNNCPPPASHQNVNMNLNCVNMVPVGTPGGFNMNTAHCALPLVLPHKERHHSGGATESMAAAGMRVP